MFKFLVATNDDRAALCEGGVYSDDSAMLARVPDYEGNNFAAGAAEVDRLNAGNLTRGWRYELRDSMDGVGAEDTEVLSSLAEWQLAAIVASEGVRLTEMGAVFNERTRRVVDGALPGFVLIDAQGQDARTTESARTAQEIAGANDRIWHKPGDPQRPYELDAFRLQALADMEAGRDLVLRKGALSRAYVDPIRPLAMAADAIRECYDVRSPDAIADNVARWIGKAARELVRRSDLETANAAIAGLGDELSEARFLLADWKGKAEAMDAARGAAVRETEALRRQKVEAENKYREACLELNRLRADGVAARDTIRKQAGEIATYREQRDAEGARAANLARQFDSSDRQWKAERLAHEALDAATRPLMSELGGLTLSMLPKGAYGGALASEYSEARPLFAYADARARAAAYGEQEA
jgi:hypothetical protein